jgi:hypothetical protein
MSFIRVSNIRHLFEVVNENAGSLESIRRQCLEVEFEMCRPLSLLRGASVLRETSRRLVAVLSPLDVSCCEGLHLLWSGAVMCSRDDVSL